MTDYSAHTNISFTRLLELLYSLRGTDALACARQLSTSWTKLLSVKRYFNCIERVHVMMSVSILPVICACKRSPYTSPRLYDI